MILPKKKLLMVGLGNRPFSNKGSFEGGLDGFTLTNMARRQAANVARTGEFSIYTPTGSGSVTSTLIPAEKAGGLMVSISMYCRNAADGSRSVEGFCSIDGGAFNSLGSKNIGVAGGAYALQTWAVTVPRRSRVQFRLIASDANIYMDDWTISGARS